MCILRFGFKSDKGRVRKTNEDSYNVIAQNEGNLFFFIVADGMGGHSFGDIASKMAVDKVSTRLISFSKGMDVGQVNNKEMIDIIKEGMILANNQIFEQSLLPSDEPHDMGTTLTIAAVCNNKLFAGHVGDSRLYKISHNKIVQLTQDHSYIGELLRTGSLTLEEARNHPRKNVITRALGFYKDIEIDIGVWDIAQEDIFLLCTDGLSNMVNDNEILSIVCSRNKNFQEICNTLVDTANLNGGQDNVSVIMFGMINENND